MHKVKITILFFFCQAVLVGQTTPYRITSVVSQFVRPIQRELPYHGKVYKHPRVFDNGSEYLITLEVLQLHGTITIDSQLTILCFLPDLSTQKVPIIAQRILEQSAGYFSYSFPVQVFNDGWVEFGVTQGAHLLEGNHKESYYSVRKDQKVYLTKRQN